MGAKLAVATAAADREAAVPTFMDRPDDIVGSTDMTQRLGDAKAMDLVRIHDRIVRRGLIECGGTEVKHTGDGIMASFASVERAINCAMTIQRELADHAVEAEHPIHVRI